MSTPHSPQSAPQSTPQKVRKKRRKKPGSLWQRWERTELDEKFLIVLIVLVFVAVCVIAGMGVMTRKVIVAQKNRARPTVINLRPPELTRPFQCDLKTGFRSGAIQTYIRNDGNAAAEDIYQTFGFRIVPDQKVNIAEFDEIPSGDCNAQPAAPSPRFGLGVGQQVTPELPQPTVILPPLLKGEVSRLYGVSCAYYADAAGTRHASCDTYRLRLASGTDIFMCDGSEQLGRFEPGPVVNCGN